ncbi:hypothetical protein SAMN05216188_107118 [Lentzea xinjiangensis]|uniref:Uncharacterized protein n=1 Tax=Lentzea xinjiangensis TaxID=402600 RepID=A0A1H9KU23_9PSEU|nr:hypothetical protein [Lentzea xinjiangensis]SER02656.1 hypothetical protein SAMN05216188_107118 [Lentzea xinjiangensis]
MRNLERRYRTLLRVLPRWYREDREEEMVGIFLAGRGDDLDLEHGWPGWGETGAVLGLAVRTHLAAGAGLTGVPVGAMWRGEVVRALGVIGLLLGVLGVGVSLAGMVYEAGHPELPGRDAVVVVVDLLPAVAFAALLAGKRTLAKSVAFAAAVPGLLAFGPQVGSWLMWQLPALVTFAALCLGFHREAPTPPAGRLAWWGGGALVLGLAGWVVPAAFVVVAALVVLRVVAFVRGDFVLGRALSLFAVLELGPVALLLAGGVRWWVVLVPAVLLVVSAVAPVRKPGFA